MRVLVVEDERLLADAIAEGLRRQAMAVDVAYDGEVAIERLAVNDYDVVVLDRDLPIVPGDEVCTSVVESGLDTRVLMLTAATTVSQRVAGLGLGADDYLTKPFAFAELTARVQALGRRARPAAPPVLNRAGIRLDPHRHTVSRDGRPATLSRKEFAVLAELLRADGGVVPPGHRGVFSVARRSPGSTSASRSPSRRQPRREPATRTAAPARAAA
jgi:DNA-binding response OmpR family regulator